MRFSIFLVERLELLERAMRGYGHEITERALYEALSAVLPQTEDFAVLIEWGLVTGLLMEIDSVVGRRFRINRPALTALRQRANGEAGGIDTRRPPRR